MKGFVETPGHIVDRMVADLLERKPPTRDSRILDPGCGRGAFVDGVLRWVKANGAGNPRIIAVDSDPEHAGYSQSRFAHVSNVEVRCADFLAADLGNFDYIIGNPPYVALTALSPAERERYRRHFLSATGRFDLYLLFLERAINCLVPGGRLIFITPEKFLYVKTAAPLRRLMARLDIERLLFAPEDTFDGRITYPLITTVVAQPPSGSTEVLHRDGTRTRVHLRDGAPSWFPDSLAEAHDTGSATLGSVCVRVSCGVATGADQVFVREESKLPIGLREFARPTLSGRQIMPNGSVLHSDVMLLPYDADGRLLSEPELGELGQYMAEESTRKRLLARTCVRHKPWYAFHETPPLRHILRPKILCKDIGERPLFVVDATGTVVPRHSVYYIVPPGWLSLDVLVDYLNSSEAAAWLMAHCQRAAGGFIRLQSHVLKKLPLPAGFSEGTDLFSTHLEQGR